LPTGGFSIDASVRIDATNRTARERLLSYCAKSPFPLRCVCKRLLTKNFCGKRERTKLAKFISLPTDCRLTALSLVVLHYEFKRVTAAHFWSIHCSES
jgi:hypothetical protein